MNEDNKNELNISEPEWQASAYSIESLNEIRRKVDDVYNAGKLTDKEYDKLIKLMDYIVEKGVKCIMVGL